MKRIILSILFCFALISCANPSYYRTDKAFQPSSWEKIAVLPFSGDVRFADEMTDVFSMHLLDQDKYAVLEESALQDVIKKVVIQTEGNEISVGDAQRIGQLAGVQAVILGNVNTHKTGATLNGFATVRLIDVETGKVVAASHKPSGLLMVWSEHQCVTKAVERAAKDILVYLKK